MDANISTNEHNSNSTLRVGSVSEWKDREDQHQPVVINTLNSQNTHARQYGSSRYIRQCLVFHDERGRRANLGDSIP
jgi:hypothetical protein